MHVGVSTNIGVCLVFEGTLCGVVLKGILQRHHFCFFLRLAGKPFIHFKMAVRQKAGLLQVVCCLMPNMIMMIHIALLNLVFHSAAAYSAVVARIALALVRRTLADVTRH